MNHTQAKQIVDKVLPELTPAENLAVRAVSVAERAHYGDGWKGAGAGSKNWGAITMKSEDKDCGMNGFPHEDKRNVDGKVVTYTTCFRWYDSHEDAAKDLAKVMLKPNVRAACAAGDLPGISVAMRDNNYYLGIKPTRAEQIADHQKAMSEAVSKILAETGEPNPFVQGEEEESPPSSSPEQPDTSSGKLPTLRKGDKGSAVGLWQRILKSSEVTDDEDFGPITEAYTKLWQCRKGLPETGVVDEDIWKEAP